MFVRRHKYKSEDCNKTRIKQSIGQGRLYNLQHSLI